MVIIDHPQFKALYFSEACSFEVPENGEFVITGGWKGSNHHGIKRVQVYTTTGVKEQLPDMNHARHAHGCSYFHDASGKLVKCIEGCCWPQYHRNIVESTTHLPTSVQVYLVVGGWHITTLDTTVLLSLGAARWQYSGKLPSARYGLRAATVDNKVIVTGR